MVQLQHERWMNEQSRQEKEEEQKEDCTKHGYVQKWAMGVVGLEGGINVTEQ